MCRLIPAVCVLVCGASYAQTGQNPSPMVEHTRRHPRLREEHPPGKRIPLKTGVLFVPEGLPDWIPLFVHFHGGGWIPEVAASRQRAAVISVQLGSGSATYARPFLDPAAFGELLKEAGERSGKRFGTVALTAWSAGYGAVREILKQPEYYERVGFVLLLDGLHCGYAGGKPGPLESELTADDLDVFIRFARDAAAGRKKLTLSHTEIFPGTFASTTETADYLLLNLGLTRKPTLRWGPMGTQILCEARKGGFHLLGFAGNSAPDHVDLLHALPDLLRAEWRGRK